MNCKFLVDEFYTWFIIWPYKRLADFFAQPVDQGVIDGFVNGLGGLMTTTAAALRKLQNGFARSYALSVVVGIVFILVYLLFRV